MNQYPAKPMMDQMAQYGRYGDSMLVHMNPVEVAGLASLSPTGKLTTNPVTGQPEAFLPLLAPALGILGGALKLGTLGTAALTGIGTAAVTGDLKRGLVAGLTSGIMSGVGGELADAFGGADAATTLSDSAQAGSELANIGAEAATTGTDLAATAVDPNALTMSAQNAAADAAAMGLPGAPAAGLTSPNMSLVGADASGIAPPAAPSGFEAFSQNVDTMVGNLSPMQATLIGGMGAGELAQMDYQDELDAQAAKLNRESEQKRQDAYADLQGAYAAAQPGIMGGLSPYRSMMSRRTPMPMYMAEGGTTDVGNPAGGSQQIDVIGNLVRNGVITEEQAEALRSGEMTWDELSDDMRATDQPESETESETAPPKPTAAELPFDVPPVGEEIDVLQKAEFGTVLTPEEQQILEGYYARREQARQERADQVAVDGRDAGIDYQRFAQAAGGSFGYVPGGGIGIDPVGVQAALRGKFSVGTPQDYMTGFEPEFSYFQDDPNAPFVPYRGYRPVETGITSEGAYFDPILDREQYLQQLRDYYTMLASYMPAQVEYVEDDPLGGTDPDAGSFNENPPGGTPSGGTPSGGTDSAANVSLLTGKSWEDMTPAERIAHAIARGNTEYSDRFKGTAAYDQAQDMLKGDDYSRAMQYEAIDRAAAGKTDPGNTLQEMLERAGFNSYDEYLAANTESFQSSQLGDLNRYRAPSAGTTSSGTPSTQASAASTDESWGWAGVAAPREPTTQTFELYDATKAGATPEAQAQIQSYIDQGIIDEQGRLLTENLSSSDLYEFGTGGFGIGSSDLQRSLIEQANAAISGDTLAYNEPEPAQRPQVQEPITTTEGTRSQTNETSSFTSPADRGIASIAKQPAPKQVAAQPAPKESRFTGKTWQEMTPTERIAHSIKAGTSYADRFDEEKLAEAKAMIEERGYAEGGEVMLRTPMGETAVPAGGIANMPTEFNASMPTEEEFNMVASAVLGKVEDADVIIDMFVRKYGPEIFSQIRNMILQSVVPNAQTEGMIEGAGGGMDDMVGGMIGDQQPVAVSPGEYIVPADVVSGLGDGSSDAGAEELDQMLERVRMARGGTTEQAPPIDAKRAMPL